jgi:protein SCO1/2
MSSNVRRPSKEDFVPARFELVDHDGTPVTNESYLGRYALVFFGFTHCKAVCPRALGKLSAVLDQLGEHADGLVPLYVTVDPERDSPEVMKAFLGANFPRFTGLTGSREQVDQAKQQFRVFAARRADPNDPEGYIVPHSAITYVLGPSGTFITHFTDATEPSVMATELKRLLDDEGVSQQN